MHELANIKKKWTNMFLIFTVDTEISLKWSSQIFHVPITQNNSAQKTIKKTNIEGNIKWEVPNTSKTFI